eukprot:jgi/Phyca11/17988/fgenesh1_pg.PHYCAscaffold_32_\
MGNAFLLAAVKDRQAVALADAILPFDNLQLHEIETFWRAFYDSATSFALSKSQFRKKRWQQSQLGSRGLQSQQYQNSNDSLAVIDALEFLSAIAFIAAIPLDEKQHGDEPGNDGR